MSERWEKLRQAVDELEDQLQGTESLDDEARSLLEDASQLVQSALEKQDATHLEQHSLADRLRGSVEEFEAEHPTLASVINRVIDILGQMGI